VTEFNTQIIEAKGRGKLDKMQQHEKKIKHRLNDGRKHGD